MDKPKKLILDYSKWICGEGGSNQLGKGCVALKNDEGFYCCLGMWSLQCGAADEELLNYGEPNEISTLIHLFVEENKYTHKEYNPITGEYHTYTETNRYTNLFASKAIEINDDQDTTPEHKIHLLTELLAKEGIELEVINKP